MASSSNSEKLAPERYGFVNALRGFAFMLVLLVHCANTIADLPPKLDQLVGQGARGVQLFFLISAFTLVHSLAAREGREEKLILNFFLRRFFRIAPLFWLAICIWLWIDGPSAPRYWAPQGVSPSGIALTFLFLNGWHPDTLTAIVPGGWSIAVEMMFYLLVPFLYRSVRNLQAALWLVLATLIAGSLSSALLNKWMHQFYPAKFNYMLDSFFSLWLPMQLHVFALGFVLYFILKKQSLEGRSPASAANRKSEAWLLLGTALYLLIGGAFGRLAVIPVYLIYGTGFLFFSWSFAMRPLPLLVNRLTNHIGIVSFSAYVNHFLVLHAIQALSPTIPALQRLLCVHSSPITQLVVLYGFAFAITMLASTLTWRIIEEPGIALGRIVIRALNKNREPANG
jgi:exopolysaccharide production protein ExoZ